MRNHLREINYSTIDIDEIRILISGIGSFYFCMFTNSLSNSISDLRINNLISRYLTSKKIAQHENISLDEIFSIILALDDVLGHEYVNSNNYEYFQSCLTMESKEEELQEALNKVKHNIK